MSGITPNAPAPAAETPAGRLRAVFDTDASRDRVTGFGAAVLAASPLVLMQLPVAAGWVAAAGAAAVAGAVALWRWGRLRAAVELTAGPLGLEVVLTTPEGRGRGDPMRVPWALMDEPEVRRRLVPRGATLWISWRDATGRTLLRHDGPRPEAEAFAARMRDRIDAAVPQRGLARAVGQAAALASRQAADRPPNGRVAAVAAALTALPFLFSFLGVGTPVAAPFIAAAPAGLLVGEVQRWFRRWRQGRLEAAAAALRDADGGSASPSATP
jgi:hypothetical protein